MSGIAKVEGKSTSAAPSALGYIAQVEYALLLVLNRLNVDFDFDVSLEALDDIAFEFGEGTAEQLIQVKHRVDRTAAISDYEGDLWKTLYNWIGSSPSGASLIFFTNATADEGSAAFYLRGGSDRDVESAHRTLISVARTSESKTNEKYYAAFLKLETDERISFLEQITILDGQASADQIAVALELAVRKSTIPAHRSSLVERLRGWWIDKSVEHLSIVAKGGPDRISALEVEGKLLAIAQSLRDHDLPIDFGDMAQPTSGEVEAEHRPFAQQLRLIAMGSERLRQCIYDHNRAFAQRSKWQRERLLHIGELQEFEDRLRDEWRRHFIPVGEVTYATDEDALEAARDRFARLDGSALPRIRSHVAAGYVSNGSLHMMADRLEVGWHPDWLARMKEVLGDVIGPEGHSGAA